jgi:hypothetical protein
MAIDVKTELISPQRASKYLDLNKGNRSLRPGVVEKYASDMKSGNWTESPVPISFYADGDIADGQHRLWAIADSGVAIKFLVVRGLPRESGVNIDTGLQRNLVDNAKISGKNLHLSTNLLAATALYESGKRQYNGISNATRLAMAEKYSEQCQWAISHGPNCKGFRNAQITCAIARAYAAGEDPNRLAEFGAVCRTGMPVDGGDIAAIALRNYVIQRDFSPVGVGDGYEFFLKVQNVIWHFVHRKSLRSMRTIEKEMYPLKKKK